jgi:hypothetical protein
VFTDVSDPPVEAAAMSQNSTSKVRGGGPLLLRDPERYLAIQRMPETSLPPLSVSHNTSPEKKNKLSLRCPACV